jgi:hypothetical protein
MWTWARIQINGKTQNPKSINSIVHNINYKVQSLWHMVLTTNLSRSILDERGLAK